MGDGEKSKAYTLVICEKPDAAKRVAEALAEGSAVRTLVGGMPVYRFRHDSLEMTVCSALGHVYTISDPFDERTVYPVFDVEWYSRNLVEDGRTDVQRRISAIGLLSEGASRVVNACDFDVEGETIGFNILRYACKGREKEALRAKLSTLTTQDIGAAFSSLKPTTDGLARAGRVRHLVDFIWGVNLSRVLSRSSVTPAQRYRVISMGRVQGPALKFLAEREREIHWFVPLPYWRVSGTFELKGGKLTALYSKENLSVQSEAEKVRNDCLGKEGVVASVKRSAFDVLPPSPFNTGDLQKEAFRSYGLSPSRTLRIAESLYLNALISYPRTGSQKLPTSLDLRKVLVGLQHQKEYSKEATELLRGRLRPVEGSETDAAHPAIYPTGEHPSRTLERYTKGVYDLVVRRFLSALAPPAIRERVAFAIVVGNHKFRVEGYRTISQGWASYYSKYHRLRETTIPSLNEGEGLVMARIDVTEKFEERPARYSMGSLLEKMENEKIGTKSTRADVISTLVERGYVSGGSMILTELGFSVVEIMEVYSPQIVTTELTREIEERLEKVEEEEGDSKEILRDTVRLVSGQITSLFSEADSIGRRIMDAFPAPVTRSLGVCPVCKRGKLVIVRSRRTRKRFIGCSNYPTGCRASAPIPQRGEVKVSKSCEHCQWPVVVLERKGSPWSFCVNPNCPSRADNS